MKGFEKIDPTSVFFMTHSLRLGVLLFFFFWSIFCCCCLFVSLLLPFLWNCMHAVNLQASKKHFAYNLITFFYSLCLIWMFFVCDRIQRFNSTGKNECRFQNCCAKELKLLSSIRKWEWEREEEIENMNFCTRTNCIHTQKGM